MRWRRAEPPPATPQPASTEKWNSAGRSVAATLGMASMVCDYLAVRKSTSADVAILCHVTTVEIMVTGRWSVGRPVNSSPQYVGGGGQIQESIIALYEQKKLRGKEGILCSV